MGVDVDFCVFTWAVWAVLPDYFCAFPCRPIKRAVLVLGPRMRPRHGTGPGTGTTLAQMATGRAVLFQAMQVPAQQA